MKTKSLVCTAVALFVAASALSTAFTAQDNAQKSAEETARREAQVRRLLEITGAAQLGRGVMERMRDQFSRSPNLPPGFGKKFEELADPDALTRITVPIYVKNLTEEDTAAAIAYFESPAGGRFARAQVAITRETMEASQKWGLDLAQKVIKSLKDDDAAKKAAAGGKKEPEKK